MQPRTVSMHGTSFRSRTGISRSQGTNDKELYTYAPIIASGLAHSVWCNLRRSRPRANYQVSDRVTSRRFDETTTQEAYVFTCMFENLQMFDLRKITCVFLSASFKTLEQI